MTAIAAVGRVEHLGATSGPLVELSGLVADRGGYWAHNDSGDRARAFYVQPGGAAVEWSLPGCTAYDWEDVAIGRGPGGDAAPWLWIADTGSARPGGVSMALVGFPLPADPAKGGRVERWVRCPLAVPGLVDSESLAWSWTSGGYSIDKRAHAGLAAVWWHRVGPDGAIHSERVGAVPIELATAADITRDGSWAAVRNYVSAWFWQRRPGESTRALWNRDPDLRIDDHAGAEAIALELDPTSGTLTYTCVAEGLGSRFTRRAVALP